MMGAKRQVRAKAASSRRLLRFAPPHWLDRSRWLNLRTVEHCNQSLFAIYNELKN